MKIFGTCSIPLTKINDTLYCIANTLIQSKIALYTYDPIFDTTDITR